MGQQGRGMGGMCGVAQAMPMRSVMLMHCPIAAASPDGTAPTDSCGSGRTQGPCRGQPSLGSRHGRCPVKGRAVAARMHGSDRTYSRSSVNPCWEAGRIGASKQGMIGTAKTAHLLGRSCVPRAPGCAPMRGATGSGCPEGRGWSWMPALVSCWGRGYGCVFYGFSEETWRWVQDAGSATPSGTHLANLPKVPHGLPTLINAIPCSAHSAYLQRSVACVDTCCCSPFPPPTLPHPPPYRRSFPHPPRSTRPGWSTPS